jgi:hypothetical protein
MVGSFENSNDRLVSITFGGRFAQLSGFQFLKKNLLHLVVG